MCVADSESRVVRPGDGASPSSLLFPLRRENPFSRLLLSSHEREREPFARFYDSLAELSDFDPLLVAKRQLGFLAVTKEAILQTTN